MFAVASPIHQATRGSRLPARSATLSEWPQGHPAEGSIARPSGRQSSEVHPEESLGVHDGLLTAVCPQNSTLCSISGRICQKPVSPISLVKAQKQSMAGFGRQLVVYATATIWAKPS